MNQYEKPVVVVNEELAEGVYAASGASNVSVTYQRSENAETHIFGISVNNPTDGALEKETIVVNFDRAIEVLECEASSRSYLGRGCTLNYGRHLNKGDKNQYFGILKVKADGVPNVSDAKLSI